MEAMREIWFRCGRCGRESYCGVEFDRLDDPDVLCPFCGQLMKLEETRLDRRRPSARAGAEAARRPG